jgi:hypothetical protein
MLRETQGNRIRSWTYTSFLPEAQSLFARFTTPPTLARQILINNLINSLVSAGVWAKLDALYVMAAADAQSARQNWIANQYNLTPVSAPTFTADRGYQGNGTSSYLGTGFNATTAVSPKFVQNSGAIAVWSRTDVANANYFDCGSASSVSSQYRFNSRSTNADTMRGALNVGGLVNYGAAGTSLGHFALSRTASNLTTAYRNGVSLATEASLSVTLENVEFRILTSGGVFSARQLAISHIGSGLTVGETLAAYNAFNTYLQAVGAA